MRWVAAVLAMWTLAPGCGSKSGEKEGQPATTAGAPRKRDPSRCGDGAEPYDRKEVGAPTVVGCRRKDGSFVGPYKVTMPDGVVTAEGQFVSGKRDGHWTYRHPSGKIWKEGEYVQGKLHGVWKQYDMEGKLLGESKLDHGTGTETVWWDNGKIRQSVERKEGVADGKTTWYFETGEKLMEADYLAGKLHGSWTFWDIKGQLRKVETWEDGIIGNTVWYENGMPLTQ